MHTVAGAIHITTGDAFVRLHQIEIFPRQRTTDTARKAPVAPDVADIERIADHRRDDAVLFPSAGDEGNGDVVLLQCRQRMIDKTFRAAKRRVARAYQRNARRGQSDFKRRMCIMARKITNFLPGA